jgi:subtilisin family serine protease
MAAPMVSGAAALVWGENESLGPDQVKNILMRSAEKIDNLKPFIRGGRSLNLLNAMDTANGFDADLLFENSIMCGPDADIF